MTTITPKTILVVDDTDFSRKATRSLIESLGYHCIETSTGTDALEIARQKLPDLILLDILMPGIDGFETAKRYRENISVSTPIVMYTALDDVDTRVRSIQSGANDVLTKPTKRKLIEVRIRTLLDQFVRFERLSSTQNVAFALIKAMETKSKYTCGHSRRVGLWSAKIAEEFGLGEDRTAIIKIAGMLHDVGKIGVPDQILEKPSKLTDDEMTIMRTHPSLGELILKSGDADPIVLQVAHSHHERMDGKGYPDGIPAGELPLEVRIVQVADVFDAITSRRPYQGATPPERAVELLHQAAGDGRLDGEVVQMLVNVVRAGKESHTH
ncbi:MAG: HD domain-containing phosphohydrolase [Planctomycetota bacterium]